VYLLNCGSAQKIGPGQKRRYAITLSVPSDFPDGRVRLRWGDEGAGAL